MKVYSLFFLSLLLLNFCTQKEEIIPRKAIVISVIGDVLASGKKVHLAQEIIDEEIIVGKNSMCDLQLLDSDSLVVLRLKSYSKFKLSGKKVGSKIQNLFTFNYGTGIFNVSKVASQEQIKTLTPTLTAGVRGTKYEVNIQPNGSTKILVLEGEIQAKPRIPEIEKLSSSQSVAKTISKTLDKKEFKIKSGEFSEIPAEVKNKLLKDTGLESTQGNTPKEVGQNIELEKLEEKLAQMEKDELNFSTKEIDLQTQKQKLKEYDEIVPFEKTQINDPKIRTALIQARFRKIEKNWWEMFKEWLKSF